LDHCSDRLGFLSRRVQTLEDENLRLTSDQTHAMESLTSAAEAKHEVEERLVESFVDILNAKKRRIDELTEEVDRLQEKLISKQADLPAMESKFLFRPNRKAKRLYPGTPTIAVTIQMRKGSNMNRLGETTPIEFQTWTICH